MPVSAPKPCRHPGCKALVRGAAYCETHKPKQGPHGSVGQRKTGRQGVKDRDRIKRRDCGLCQTCLECGVIRQGTEVDHTIPLSQGGADSDENKRLLCTQCHKAKSARERQRLGRGG